MSAVFKEEIGKAKEAAKALAQTKISARIPPPPSVRVGVTVADPNEKPRDVNEMGEEERAAVEEEPSEELTNAMNMSDLSIRVQGQPLYASAEQDDFSQSVVGHLFSKVEKFKLYSTMVRPDVYVLGPYCSGTNAMQEYIEANFAATVHPRPKSDGKKVQTGVIYGKSSNKDWMMWKHTLPWQRLEFPTTNSVVILMIREPCAWLASVNSAMYELQTCSYQKRQKKQPWTCHRVAFQKTPGNCNDHEFPDAVTIWRHYAQGYATGAISVSSGERDPYQNVVIVRHEDLVTSPKAVMAALESLGLPPKNPGKYTIFNNARSGPNGSQRNRAELMASVKCAPPDCSREMMAKVRDVLSRDTALMSFYGYRLPEELTPVDNAQQSGLVDFFGIQSDDPAEFGFLDRNIVRGMQEGGITDEQAPVWIWDKN